MTGTGEGRADLTSQLIEIVASESMIDVSRLTLETPLEELEIQSADYVMILMAIEEKFGTYISVDTDFTEAKTVGDLVSIITRKIEDAGISA